MIGVLVGLALASVCIAPIAAFGWWMVRLGFDGGDQPGDATSRLINARPGSAWLVVSNPSATPVVVGARVRLERGPAIVASPPRLIKRPARYLERRTDAAWSDSILGAVPPGSVARWFVSVTTARTRLLVAIGQPGGRLHIHDHLLTSPRRPKDTD